MAFRDDRDAQLARAHALERENERLKVELARRSDEASAANAQVSPLTEENARLRAQLEGARRPGLWRRARARLAALKLDAPSGEGTYWHAALAVWRIHAPLVVGFAATAAFLDARAVWVCVLFAFAAPAFAGLALLVPWALGRRRRVVAGAVAAAALGPPLSLLLYDRLLHAPRELTLYLTPVAFGIAAVAMALTRVLPWRYTFCALFASILIFPSPGHVLLWCMLGLLGAELASPSRE